MPSNPASAIVIRKNALGAGVKLRVRGEYFVESLMSLGAFIVLMAILFAVPDPSKSVTAKTQATELRTAA